MIIVQVGSADSSGAEPHQYLAILRARLGAILNFELFGSAKNTSDHRGVGAFQALEGFRYFASPFGQQCNLLGESRVRQSSASDLPPRWL